MIDLLTTKYEDLPQAEKDALRQMDRYTFNRRHWEGLFGTGGWVEEKDRFKHVQFVVPVESDSRIMLFRTGGFFGGGGTGIHECEWTELRIGRRLPIPDSDEVAAEVEEG